MKDYRCPFCGRVLFKSDASAGTVQAVCRDCRAVRVVHLDHKRVAPQTTRK